MMNSHRPQRLLWEGLTNTQHSPDKPVAIIEGTSYSHSELRESALRLAAAMINHGLERGDRVAIYMDNTWPCIVSIYAVLMAGGVFMVINPQTKSGKLQYLLEDSSARILVTDRHLESLFLPAIEHIAGLAAVFVSGQEAGEKPPQSTHPIHAFTEIIQQYRPLEAPITVLQNDLAALIYTSGSTGEPKGVMHTHQSMVFVSWSLIEYLRLSQDDKILVVLPFAFDYGLYQLIMAVQLGATLVVERSFTFPALIYNRIDKERVTVFPGVPTIYSMMIEAHHRKKLCFPSVMRITNTAAALPESYLYELQEIFPNALIYKMYGLTECKRVSFLEPEMLNKKPGSVGKAIPGTEVFLLRENGTQPSPGEDGILHIRGPHLMLGYWNKPEQSTEMLIPGDLPGERWLCSHDWFRMDDEGFLYFIGRTDDIIKTRGEKVSPIEVENVLNDMPGIQESAVIGIPDERLGQSLRAYVIVEEGHELSEKQIQKYAFAHLENFMVPTQTRLVTSLPKTPNGKIDKKMLARSADKADEI